MTPLFLKLFSNGFETSISFISKDLAETFVVEKKIYLELGL